MTQWRQCSSIPTRFARIGKIQQNTVDVEDKDIVLAMVWYLSMVIYDPESISIIWLSYF